MALRKSRGFTLPELMIVVTVMAVMLAIGVPSFAEFIRNQRVKTASFEVFASLVFARSGQQVNVQIPRHIAQGVLFDGGSNDTESRDNRSSGSEAMQL